MKSLLRLGLILFTCGHAYADYTDIEPRPLHTPDILSSNWLAQVQAAIPSAASTREMNFHALTNLISRESRQGNVAAQGLWGFFVVVQSQSPQATATGLELLRNSATNGFIPAMMNLAILFQRGMLVPQNYSEAFYWYGQAADKNHPEGITQLGGCYHVGLGTARDLARAAECYQRAAELTNYVAMKSLGYLLMNGLGVKKDLEVAKRWLTRAAEEGSNPRAMYNLGVLYGADTNTMAEAFQWFKRGAELGDPIACHALANYYWAGWGGVQTNQEAYRFWRHRAASLGSTAGQYAMGAAYRTGDGVPKNTESSLAWLRMAAAKNHAWALYDLAVHYLEDKTNRLSRLQAESYMLQAAEAGHRQAQFHTAENCFKSEVGMPDYENGKRWLALSAENGWPVAEYTLFELYYHGLSPTPTSPRYPKDVPQAIKWLRRAAEHKQLQAQGFLAVLLIQGKDVEKNAAEAESLLRNAAAYGYAPSQNDLGFAILTGNTARMDLVEAAMWCRLAQAQAKNADASKRAEVNLSNILPRLTAQQRLEVDARVQDFRVQSLPNPEPTAKDWERNPAYRPEDGRISH